MFQEVFMDVATALAEVRDSNGELWVPDGRGNLYDVRILGNWSDKHWMNTPGPVYCGQTDNCGTGPLAAPNNVCVDDQGYEVIFRQPTTELELHQTLQAAAWDPFSGYAVDGNSHWSYQAIREWWSRRKELEQEISKLKHFATTYQDWLDYLRGDLHLYLRVYAFFLEEGHIPTFHDVLPNV